MGQQESTEGHPDGFDSRVDIVPVQLHSAASREALATGMHVVSLEHQFAFYL